MSDPKSMPDPKPIPDAALIAAVRKAVDNGLLLKAVWGTDVYLKNWDKVRDVVQAALDTMED